jgi:hypothetical protein
MELTTVQELIKALEQLPQNSQVYVGGTIGYLHVIEDDNGNTVVSFDDDEEIYL